MPHPTDKQAMYERLRAYFQRQLAISDAQFEVVKQALIPKVLQRNELVVWQGEVERRGAFVVKGCLRSYVVDKKEKEHIIQFAPENWWISDQHSMLRGLPAMCSIEAVEESEVLLFGPDFFPLLQTLGPAFQAFFHTLLQNSMAAMQRRLIATLSATAEERYLEFLQMYPTLVQRLPQRMIAAYLGVTPESLSRIRKELARS
ncbi:Crp/Fnr family transcriptional regulator [Hymenobacter sp. GOD-10R]|uniref:Crp/Fnr family transcriptional regulator n=1 Tax=Hymenobacter sp. GOD-10R TaxID=3093922 RepID=UPI002D77EF39|nr:Crp/Fnr family transcriptional regulator [Hymenobacter sp. GOD-10R]WRQ30526.1 Crp/Fnr family transcriptional regulator [Hymenobacter sp. GOD-10R]